MARGLYRQPPQPQARRPFLIPADPGGGGGGTVQVLEASGSGVTAATTTWVDVATIAAGSFTTGAKYLILAFAQGQVTSSADEIRLRLVHGTTPTEFTDAFDAEEILANTSRVGVGWMALFTQPGTTEDIKVQVSNSATSTSTAEYAHIIAINLDDVGVEDTAWRWNEATGDLTLTTSYQDGASETFTPNGSDKYLYIGQAAWDVGDSSTEQTDVALDVDGTIRTLISEEGEDAATEQRNRLMVWAETPTNASHTVKVKAKNETAAAASSLLSSRVFVLNLSTFAQAAVDASAGPTNLVEGSGWINLATLSITPDTTGDFVLLGAMVQDWNAGASTVPEGRMQVNPDGSGLVSRPAYGDDGLGADTWDGTDQRTLVLMDVVSLTSGGARTINLDGQMNAVGLVDPIVFDRALVAFSVAKPGGGGSSVDRTVTDALALADAIVRTFTGSRILADALSLGDAVTRLVTLARSATDALSLSDSVTRVLTAARTATDALGLGNAVVRIVTLTRTSADALGISDAVTRALTLGRTAADSLSFSESVSAIRLIVRTVADSLGLADAVTRVATLGRTATDSTTIGNAVTRVLTLARATADALSLGDAVTRAVTLARTATDAVTYGNTVGRALTLGRTTADALSLGDAVTRVGTFLRAAADAVGFSDAVDAVKSGTIVRTVADSLNLADAVTRTGTFGRTLADAISLANVVDRAKAAVRTAADSLAIADAVTRAKTAVRAASDALTIGNVVTRAVAFVRAVSDGLGISDLLAVAGGGLTIIGGFPPIAAARRFLSGATGSAPKPGGTAGTPTPGGDASNPKPGS